MIVRYMREGWKLEKSSKISVPGTEISLPEFNDDSWLDCTVPSTVLGCLVDNGVYSNLYFSDNLTQVDEDGFRDQWWYRNKFIIDNSDENEKWRLDFKGINYKASIFLNGNCLASEDSVVGAFRMHSFDISDFIQVGTNILAVQVTPPVPGDFSTGFVDWNPPPPDRNMGLFKEVLLLKNNGVSLNHPNVESRFKNRDYSKVFLHISAQLVNHLDEIATAILVIKTEKANFEKLFTLQPREEIWIKFSPEEFPELVWDRPELWWPYQWGSPHLHKLKLQVLIEGKLSDVSQIDFGIREIKDYFSNGHRGFEINGEKILIKGAGWTDDLLLRDTARSISDQIAYVKHLNLNCIRLEGFWGKDEKIYEKCDQEGILVMVGWSCQWEHEEYLGKPTDPDYGGVVTDEDIHLIAKSWQDQVLWLRHHCCIFTWAVASDFLPHPELEKKYVEIFKKFDQSRPYLNSTGGVGSEQSIITENEIISDISGSSGMKMLGPYAYTPPIYWYTDTTRGGAYGFNTETCPGANVPPIQSILKMLPVEHLWPIDHVWNFHCGLNDFSHLERIVNAVDNRFGKSTDPEDFAIKAQLLNYELMRPMFEAFRVNHPKATGVIQWMLNSAFPSFYWQLYDYYLMPNAAFYSARKGCAPLQVIFHYKNNAIYLVNEQLSSIKDLTVKITIYDVNSHVVCTQKMECDAGKKSVQKLLDIPVELVNKNCFAYFQIFNNSGSELANNFYWLSSKRDQLDYTSKSHTWEFYTPTRSYADFKWLMTLPKAMIKVDAQKPGISNEIEVTITNQSRTMAFFIELRLLSRVGNWDLLPIFWQDNYISIPPHKHQKISVRTKQISGEKEIRLLVKGINTGIEEVLVKIKD